MRNTSCYPWSVMFKPTRVPLVLKNEPNALNIHSCDCYGSLHQESWTPNPTYQAQRDHLLELNPEKMSNNVFECSHLRVKSLKITGTVVPETRAIETFYVENPLLSVQNFWCKHPYFIYHEDVRPLWHYWYKHRIYSTSVVSVSKHSSKVTPKT